MQLIDSEIEILLNERNRIHAELLSHKATQQTVLNFIIFLIGAEQAAFSQASAFFLHFQSIFLLVPIPFALLAIYHSGYTARIHHIASYLDGELRDRLEARTSASLLAGFSYRPIRNLFDFFSSSTRRQKNLHLTLRPEDVSPNSTTRNMAKPKQYYGAMVSGAWTRKCIAGSALDMGAFLC